MGGASTHCMCAHEERWLTISIACKIRLVFLSICLCTVKNTRLVQNNRGTSLGEQKRGIKEMTDTFSTEGYSATDSGKGL